MPTAPPAIFVPASGGGAPSAPPAIFVAAVGGGGVTAPPAIFVPTTGGGGSLSSPPPIFGMPVGAIYNSDYGILRNSDGSVLFSGESAEPQIRFLETGFSGSNNDLRFEQIGSGTAPTIQFAMDNAGGNSVSVTGTAILIHLRRNFSNFYLPAADIKQLLADSSAASALVTVGYPAGNNGTGQICQPTTANISFGPVPLTL